MGIEGNVEAVGDEGQGPRGFSKAHIVDIDLRLCGLEAVVRSGIDAIGFEDLLDDLALRGAEMEAVLSGGGRQHYGFAGGACRLFVERLRLPTGDVDAQFIEMLSGFDIPGIDFDRMSERGAGACLIAAQARFSRGLNQRSDRVAAGYIGRQDVIRVGGVQLCGLFVALDRIFEVLVHEELAGGKVEFGGPAAIGTAGLVGNAGLRGSRLSLGRVLRLERGLGLGLGPQCACNQRKQRD